MARRYVPEAGEIVWLEQAGHRPALVVSPAAYNGKTGLMLCCPMTTHIKGYPFEVVLDSKPASVVLADQVKSLDWAAREARPKGRATAAELAAVRARIVVLVGG